MLVSLVPDKKRRKWVADAKKTIQDTTDFSQGRNKEGRLRRWERTVLWWWGVFLPGLCWAIHQQLAQGGIASMCCLPKLGLWRFMFLSLVILTMTVLSLYDDDKLELIPVHLVGTFFIKDFLVCFFFIFVFCVFTLLGQLLFLLVTLIIHQGFDFFLMFLSLLSLSPWFALVLNSPVSLYPLLWCLRLCLAPGYVPFITLVRSMPLCCLLVVFLDTSSSCNKALLYFISTHWSLWSLCLGPQPAKYDDFSSACDFETQLHH